MKPTAPVFLCRAFTTIAILAWAATAAAQAPALLRDVNPNGSSIGVTGQLEILGRSPRDGDVIVMLDDGVHGYEPWRTDGTPAGTSLLLDLTPGPAGTTVMPWGTATSDARRLWFVVDGANGQNLWQTDGTTAGTSLFLSAAAVGGFSVTAPQVHKPLGDVAFFYVDGTLWRTNGLLSGTFSLGVPSADVVAIRDGVALLTNGFGDVIKSDGVTASVLFRVPAPDSYPKLFECRDGQLVLRVPQYSGWSVASTTLLWLDKPGSQPVTFPSDVTVESLDDRLLIWAGAQLLAWDGAGPPTLLRQYFGSFGGSSSRATRIGDRLLFGALDVQSGWEIWATDGTVAGTVVLDSVPGPAPGVLGLTPHTIGDKALLSGALPGTNGFLYASDGTLGGTVPLLTLAPGALVLFESVSVPLGSRRGALSLHLNGIGNELYVTGSTAGSMAIAADVNPGPASSLPEFMSPSYYGPWRGIVAGNVLVWGADDGVLGTEPWSLPLTGIRTLLREYGRRAFEVSDPVLGGSLDFTAARLAGSDLGVVALGFPVAMPLPFAPGQFLHFDPASALGVAIVLPGPTGRWNASLSLAAAPSLIGLDLVAQPLFVAPTATGLEVGHAYWLTLGP
jgi:ELWxxDGT repeat protein